MAKNKHKGRPKSCDNVPNGGACKKRRNKGNPVCRNCQAVK